MVCGVSAFPLGDICVKSSVEDDDDGTKSPCSNAISKKS